ncbi:PREDICTED: uncharacterized protein LOC106810034 [Priapulus caudatus]|uniref:Uncharacterized protein LOC106810034 n=1 Tax=Priapulus caudatus TaxID=37621 RepID=A0ABM1E9B4_PRICU|nr:PREDICTED: uncharacterized protein LOC106810034 [Priapulus caudatus]
MASCAYLRLFRVNAFKTKSLLTPIISNGQTQRSYSNQTLSGKTVRIGCASGFWGDTAVSAPQLIYGGNIQFLVFDYLSEITMSLLTAAKQKSPELGYAPDFVQVSMAPYLKDIKAKGVRVVSNAGGVNPDACAKALLAAAAKAGVDNLKVAVITGDDLMSQKTSLSEQGIKEMDSGMNFPKTVHSMNAYIGAGPIARALDLGADVVVTGRCVDSALALGPLLHTFKWSPKDYDKLAAGSLAGHLIECGAQATGGIFTDWHKVPDWDNIGFPIVECADNGDIVVTKPPKTGGLVNTFTVSEQLLYEIGDPRSYMLPDVVCDFTNVSLKDMEGSVFVSGAKGMPPSNTYKVSATYADGFRATAMCPVGGPRAAEKVHRTTEAILKRCRTLFKALKLEDFTEVNVAVLGSEDMYGPMASADLKASREVALWLAVHHQQKKALEVFVREIAPAGTGMAPGLTTIVGGRPRVAPVLKLFSFLHDKKVFKVDIHMNGEFVETYKPTMTEEVVSHSAGNKYDGLAAPVSGSHTYRLEDLAVTRSGDKGNNANIGVVARHPAYLPYLQQSLTAQAVENYFSHLYEDSVPENDRVIRYDVPGIHGFNFLLKNCLGGGGIASLRTDPQGKALGQMLLDFPIRDMPESSSLVK